MKIRPDRQPPGFSLVEMLVAVSVMAVLILMVSQIVGMSNKAIITSSRQLDGSSGARLALDRLAMDWEGRPVRSDLPVLLTKAAGNDTLEFYSAARGYGGTRGISAVAYRIQETVVDRLFQLERGAQGTDWKGGAEVAFLSTAFPVLADTDYDVLADGVFRLEYCYLKTDGTFQNTALADLRDVTAIVVAVATLDATSRKMLQDGNLARLARALPDSVDGQQPLDNWYAAINNGLAPGIAPQAVQAIHLYQRSFYVR